jgi:predicted DsbA family dithiol-disulfide isomerase
VETGVCDTNAVEEIESVQLELAKAIRLIYYTDPICSACWAIEPKLRRFKHEYGQYLDIEYRMGGLLPGWEGFADKANGIRKPEDVAGHWDHVGMTTGMSIDGDVWLEDPLSSSYPPSIAFKAVQLQDEKKALHFLRYIREFVFLEKKNITKDEHLIQAAEMAGADTTRFKLDYANEATRQSFLKEVEDGRAMGVRGFPTFILVHADGKGVRISGSSSYSIYKQALEEVLGAKVVAKPVMMTPLQVLRKYGFLSTREISELLKTSDQKVEEVLAKAVTEGKVLQERQKYGNFWRYVESN